MGRRQVPDARFASFPCSEGLREIHRAVLRRRGAVLCPPTEERRDRRQQPGACKPLHPGEGQRGCRHRHPQRLQERARTIPGSPLAGLVFTSPGGGGSPHAVSEQDLLQWLVQGQSQRTVQHTVRALQEPQDLRCGGTAERVEGAYQCDDHLRGLRRCAGPIRRTQ